MGELANFTIDQLGGTLALVLGSLGGLCLILFILLDPLGMMGKHHFHLN